MTIHFLNPCSAILDSFVPLSLLGLLLRPCCCCLWGRGAFPWPTCYCWVTSAGRQKPLDLSLVMPLGGRQGGTEFHSGHGCRRSNPLPAWIVEQGLGQPGFHCSEAAGEHSPGCGARLGLPTRFLLGFPLLLLLPQRTGFSKTACWRFQVLGLSST